MLINPPSSFNRPMMGAPGVGNQGGLAPSMPQAPAAPVMTPGVGMTQNMTPNAGPPRMGQQPVGPAGGMGPSNPGGYNPFQRPDPAGFQGPGGTNSLGATASQQQIGMLNNGTSMPNQTPQMRMMAQVQALRGRTR